MRDLMSLWPGISSPRKHVGIIDPEPYNVLHILFDNYKCGRCFQFVKYLYTSFIILLFFGIIFFMAIPYIGIHAFFFSDNIGVTHYSSHFSNWGSACQRRRVLAVRKYISAC